jgi:hypothetical protein
VSGACRKTPGQFPCDGVETKRREDCESENEIVMASQSSGDSLAEYRQQHPNRDLLRELAEGTGGKIDPDLNELVSQKREGHKNLRPLRTT